MADTQVKPEIKLDPAGPPPDMADLEEFEDDFDLHIPPPPGPDGNGPQAWLVKVPKYIWEAWNEISRNAPDEGTVEIGKMRVYATAPGEDPTKPRTQVVLSPGVYQHVELPKTYNLDIKTVGYSNTVVFSEKDLPGHHHNNNNRNYARSFSKSRTSQLQKPRGIPPKSERYASTTTSNKPGTYRTAIPKQTALAPLIYHVADAGPEQDASYYAHFNKLYQASLKPKKATHFHAGIDRGLIMQTGASHLNAFGLTSRPPGAGTVRKPPPKEKAVRISQEALLDRLYQCFRRYKYWSLKALRNELRQPEAFIKSTLESIATLVRSGDFAMNYVLRPEYAGMAEGAEVKEETALVGSADELMVEESEMEMEGLLGSAEGEGEDVEFEDV